SSVQHLTHPQLSYNVTCFILYISPYLNAANSLLYNGNGDHRDLHSFPTRRSSDLGSMNGSTQQQPKYPDNNPKTLAGSKKVPARDRKSTRLNSSHVKISYAVFCLKKKTIY